MLLPVGLRTPRLPASPPYLRLRVQGEEASAVGLQVSSGNEETEKTWRFSFIANKTNLFGVM